MLVLSSYCAFLPLPHIGRVNDGKQFHVVVLGAGVSIVKSLYWLAEGNLYRTESLEKLYQFAGDWL